MIYSPREDSFLLEIEVKKYAKDKTVLDMGSGSGIQAKAALSSGAKSILAADIDAGAIKELKKQKIPAVQSDLFSKIKGKFDLIIFNPPYLPEDKREDKESQLATAGGRHGDEIILRFIRYAKSHLTKDGIILMVISSLTPQKKILALLKRQKLNHQILSSERFFFETLEVWKISR